MESQEHVSQSSRNRLRLHSSNLQLLAALDCALALITIVFNAWQLISTISSLSENFQPSEDDAEASENKSHNIRLLIATVVSICLTLTQLILACLMMLSLSDTESSQKRVRIISGMWVSWSAILLIVLIVCAFSIKRFEDVADKFYLLMLASEIVFRVVIIIYTCLFYWCKFDRII